MNVPELIVRSTLKKLVKDKRLSKSDNWKGARANFEPKGISIKNAGKIYFKVEE